MSNMLRQLATEITDNLHTVEVKGEEERRIVWKDSAPETLRKWFRSVTGEYGDYNFDSLNEYYRVLYALCSIIEDDTSSDDVKDIEEDKLNDLIFEYGWAYDYNAWLLDWVKEDMSRLTVVDEAIANGSDGLIGGISAAMHYTRSQMANSFAQAMRERIKS